MRARPVPPPWARSIADALLWFTAATIPLSTTGMQLGVGILQPADEGKRFELSTNVVGLGREAVAADPVDRSMVEAIAGEANFHFPRVVRLHSGDGGRTASSQTTILSDAGGGGDHGTNGTTSSGRSGHPIDTQVGSVQIGGASGEERS